MKKFIAASAIIIAIAILTPSAQSAPYFWASGFGFYMPGFNTGGGAGNVTIEYNDSSTDADSGYDDPWVDWTLNVHFKGDIRDGQMGADLLSHTIAPGPSRGGPAAGVDSQMEDYFHIGAGDSGLNIGDEVQIRFLSGFSGSILLEGNPSGGCYVSYQSTLFGGPTGVLAQLKTDTDVVPSMISMYPPINQVVNVSKNQLVTVHIGDTLHMSSYLSMDLNGSSYSENQGDNDLSFLNGGFAQIGFAPGFEDIEIWSDADAIIIPEPATLSIMAIAVCLLRRK